LATFGLQTAPAAAEDPPPVVDLQASIEDPTPVGADPQASVPVQDPPPTTDEPPVPVQDPPPVTEPPVPAQDPPPPTPAVPSDDDSLTVTPTTFSPGQTIEVEARTFRPGFPVTMSMGNLARLPLAFGSTIADQSGVARLSLRIWEGVQPGRYPLYVIGETPEGDQLTLTAWLTVIPAEPAAVPPSGPAVRDPGSDRSLPRTGGGSAGLAGLGVALVAGGWLFATVAAKRRHRLDSYGPSGAGDITT
jgi:hypothetical protein